MSDSTMHIGARRFRPRLVHDSAKTEAWSPSAARDDVALSIVMPAYNEQYTIADAVVSVLNQSYPCNTELIVVDDGSTDATPRILDELDHPRARVVTHKVNMGKGAALQTGAALAQGTHLVPFDADLEYNPADLVYMLQPVLDGRSDVVYGVRLFGANTRYLSYRHALGNRILTVVASLLFDAYLSDLHTCLKLVPVDVFRQLQLRESGFGLDTEVTAKLLAEGLRPFEVPVSYHSRATSAGKKITWRDGVRCLQVLARIRSARRMPATAEHEDPLERLAASRDVLLATAIDGFAALAPDGTDPTAEEARSSVIDNASAS